MRTLLFSVSIVALLAVTLGVSSSTADGSSSTSRNNKSMTFSVASSSTDKMLEGVAVLIAGTDGQLTTVGYTDANGRLAVPKETLQMKGSTAILFCRERFFCGAFRLDDPEFFEANHRLIQLAPFAIP